MLDFANNEEGVEVANNILSVIEGLDYRPCSVEVDGNPCMEVGDGITFDSGNTIIESYILQRTLTGIVALYDSISADGVENYTEAPVTARERLQEANGKTNKFIETVDQTIRTMTDAISGLETVVEQTAEDIKLKVSKGEAITEINLEAEEQKITINADAINFTGMSTFNEAVKIGTDGYMKWKSANGSAMEYREGYLWMGDLDSFRDYMTMNYFSADLHRYNEYEYKMHNATPYFLTNLGVLQIGDASVETNVNCKTINNKTINELIDERLRYHGLIP